jgi:hypothetical protein
MSILFKTALVQVKGTGNYDATLHFDSDIANAEVALRGLGLTKYKDGTDFHYRGPTIIRVTKVEAVRNIVTFSFDFNFSQSPSDEMVGDIEFLVIAIQK